METREILQRDEWQKAVEDMQAHPLQSWQWGSLKQATGPWTARRVLCVEDGRTIGGAQVLVRKLPVPVFELAYLPRGPFAADEKDLPAVADAVAQWCKHNTRAVSVKIEPAVSELDLSAEWVESEHALIAKTATIDLTPSEDDIMKSIPNRKCRQYIRKAGRDGVVCRPGTKEDLDQILAMYHATAEADGFALHADEFYRAAFDELEGVGQLFVSEYEGRMQSFLWNATTSGTAFELWGAVTDEGKRTRANYLLKWEAIKAAKARGAVLYDMNGLLNDGISDFKLLFSKDPVYWVGTFDKPLSPLYGAMNKALEINRKRNTAANAQQDTSDERPQSEEDAALKASVRDEASLRTLRDVMASRTGTSADDWYPVFKARYGMETVFRALKEAQGSGKVVTQLLTCCTAVDPIVSAGLVPSFGEVSDVTYALDSASLSLSDDARAVVIQHTHGIVDPKMDAQIAEAAHEVGALVLEDSAHCVARISRGEDGMPIADVSVHSFGVEKMLPGTYFGGAVWINPRMGDKKLRARMVEALDNLPALPAALDRSSRSYRNQIRVLTRVPEVVGKPLHDTMVRTRTFEPAVAEEEMRGELPLEAYAPSPWVADQALKSLSQLNANEARRRSCVQTYLDVFGDALKQGKITKELLPGDLRMLKGQPLLHFPVNCPSEAVSELACRCIAGMGFYAVPWYRPLLYPGVLDTERYGWNGSAQAWPVCDRLSRGALALPTDIDAASASMIAELVVALLSEPVLSQKAGKEVREPAALAQIRNERDVRERLVPVIVGGDLLAYSYVREFHEAYGIRPIVLSSIDVKMTSSSALCEYRLVPGMHDENTVMEYLETLGRELAAQGKVGMILGLADWQTRVISRHKDELSSWYVVPYVDFDLLDTITQKDRFYAICEELGIAYPQTWELDCGPNHPALDASAYPYPLICKPANSAKWDATDFVGKCKIYELSTPAEFEEAYAAICASDYDGTLIVQDFVPGDDDAIRSLTTFSDAEGNVRVVAGGRVALQDHSPLALGNPVCILSEKVDRIVEDATRFLRHVGYRGYANFDIKYDERDGSYRFFEVNARPGRNTFYVSLGGVNFVKPLVEEFVLGREVPYAEAYEPYLYTIVPATVARKYVYDESLRDEVMACYRDGRASNPLDYAADSPVHKLWATLFTQNQSRKFARYM
ncbi:MAG: peptidoglycan bridge formation glycyltransferase FemA/FemB family protein [Coriobacteriales bacterium]|nr:peptidoglycan bridge formation glycyltransferase FemA/FemB family protein [Coriobacteriales bacterium]